MAKSTGLSAAEKQAVKDLAKEKRASQKRDKLEQAMFATIEKMPAAEQEMARRLHAIVKEEAPHLVAKTRYGMPTWAQEDGVVVLFLQAASKFSTRYSTIGFDEGAHLDEGSMWPMSWAFTTLTDDDYASIRKLVARAVRDEQ